VNRAYDADRWALWLGPRRQSSRSPILIVATDAELFGSISAGRTLGLYRVLMTVGSRQYLLRSMLPTQQGPGPSANATPPPSPTYAHPKLRLTGNLLP